MCGIAGILSFRSPINEAELNRLTDSLEHRGPDGRGIYIDGCVGLGHRRLSILDQSENGKNPMTLAGEGENLFWITFNGEIYNFIEIKSELISRGFKFRSETDTEVLLAAFSEWGEECLEKLNGMFAFAIWDHRQKRLTIVRDRFGIKPVYYFVDEHRLVFASEMKAFLALNDFEARLDIDVAYRSLLISQALEGTEEEVLLSGVRRLMPGCLLTVDQSGRHEVRQWWNTLDHLPAIAKTYAGQVDDVRELFRDAVRIRMRSDVPLGTCLSGGIDSGAVVTTMADLHRKIGANLDRCFEDWRHAFIASFPGSAIDETVFATELADTLGIRKHVWTFDSGIALDNLEASVWSVEEIYPGICVGIWSLYQSMRQSGVLVSLDGHGGDELFGGYPWYLDCTVGGLNDRLYQDFHYTLLPSILRNYDRCSMAHGIEVRMPIMDWRLVSYASAIPPEAKIGAGYTKRVFRDALKGVLPEDTRLRRQKVGFNSPMIEWFNGGLAPLIIELLNHDLFKDHPEWLSSELKQRAIQKTQTSSWIGSDWNETLEVWSRMNLVIWQKLFVERHHDMVLK